VPRAILSADLYPHYRSLLDALGYEPVPSAPSRRGTLLRAAHALTAEPCLPAKLMLGHVAELAEQGVDAVFLPAILSAPEADNVSAKGEPSRITRRYACMYGLSSGDLACAAGLADETPAARGRADAEPSRVETFLRRVLDARPLPERPGAPRGSGRGPRLLAPELILDPRSYLFRATWGAFARGEGLDVDTTCRAATDALDAYQAYRRELRAIGREYLDANRDSPVALVLGHPYVVHDSYLNLQVMRRLARAGFVPLPFDMVPETVPLGESWALVGWRSNRDLLRAAAWAAGRDDVFPVVLTCFGCGPDAFVVRFLEDSLGSRPRLTLEFDEHQAEAGLETRIEAYRNAVARPAAAPEAAPRSAPSPLYPPLERHAPRTTGRLADLRGRTVVVTRFGDVAPAFRGFLEAQGVDARLGPPIDETSLALGRPFAGGQECNPFTYFTGDMVRVLSEPGVVPGRVAFFSPSSEGACLLSQYGRGFEIAARRIGAGDVLLFNPSFSELTAGAGTRLLNRFWEALAAIESLAQLAADRRPFERERGAIDRARLRANVLLGDAVATGRVRRAVDEAVDLLAAVPCRPMTPRPAVGIVGDIFTRGNDAANRNLVRTLEDAGCRVLVPPTLTDIAAYSTGEWVHLGRSAGLLAYTLRSVLLETYQRLSGAWIRVPIGRLGPPPPLERSYRDAVKLARPYLGRPVEAMLTLNVSKAVEQLETGARGVLNVICHGCMVGILSESAFRPLREAYPGRPILTLTYDGLGDTHAATRVEAFVQRVLEAEQEAR
jgi:predicted nucleotide-binding protein (sugar kinase/HSP70/actin superfamily)